MALPVPKLDDRTFQDLVDEARKRIPRYCKEWTDHNVSDPGITLIELFAWMTEIILYRLNQVPDLHAIKFLELLGVRLGEAMPAHAPVTFWLSEPLSFAVKIPSGTEVASTQTETERSIVFTTDTDLTVSPPELDCVMSRVTAHADAKRVYNRPYSLVGLEQGFFEKAPLKVFSDVPQVGDALYFGFGNDLSYHILGFESDWDSAGGGGIDPEQPAPHIWEASTGDPTHRWVICDVASDTTKGFNVAGRIQIHLPKMGRIEVNGQSIFWVRARIVSARSAAVGHAARNTYFSSPLLKKLTVATWGGTVSATHAQQGGPEYLGRSDGTAGQRFQLQRHPLLQRRPEETLKVKVEHEPEQTWTEVPDFAESGAYDHHYTLDSATGELTLGPAVRQPDGTIKVYGAIPLRGASLVFARFRVGGGVEGNVRAGFLNTLKTSIPYVVKVENRERAKDGLDQESLADAIARAPALLRTRDRAVTEADFESLATRVLPEGSRVRCLQPRPSEAGRIAPGEIYLLVIPNVVDREGYLSKGQLELTPNLVAALTAYLDERRLLTTRLNIRAPEYSVVVVKVNLLEPASGDQTAVREKVLARLYSFLNPLVGWTDCNGWPFGRTLYAWDVYQCLQGIPDLQFIRSVEIYAADNDGHPKGDPQEFISLLAHGMIISGRHEVEFVKP